MKRIKLVLIIGIVSMFLVSCSNKDESIKTAEEDSHEANSEANSNIENVGNQNVTLNVGDLTEKLDEEKEKNSKLEEENTQLKDELQKLKDTAYESADEALKAENEELRNRIQELENKGNVAQTTTKEETDIDMLPYDGENFQNYDNKDSNKFFTMSGEKFKIGFEIQADSMDDGYVMINLKNKYNKLTFDYGHIDGTTLRDTTLSVKVDGGEVAELPLISSAGITRNQEISLNGGTTLEIRVNPTGESGTVKFGLANLRYE